MSWQAIAQDLLSIWSEVTQQTPEAGQGSLAPRPAGAPSPTGRTERRPKLRSVAQDSSGFDQP